MKKIVLILAIAIMASGAVWAQFNFSAVPTISTEARHSAGRFSSDVDDFIDPAWHNPEIGTFLFAGGYPTFLTTNVNPSNPWAISLGFGKTLGESKNYLGVYYGGTIVDDTFPASGASGTKREGIMSTKDKMTTSEVTWENNLAVLFGTAGMGIRFDLIMNNKGERTNYEGGLSYKDAEGAAVALKWGTSTLGDFVPWASIGFKFPDQEVYTFGSIDKKPNKKITASSNAELGLLAGGWYGINDTVSVVGEVGFNSGFGNSFKGDTKNAGVIGVIQALHPEADPAAPGYDPTSYYAILSSGSDPWKESGWWDLNLYAHIQKAVGFGEYMTVKFKPYLALDFASYSNNTTYMKNKDKDPSDNFFTLGTGFDVGAEYKYEKIGLYTALGLRCFEWTVDSHSGGKKKNNSVDWGFVGIEWNTATLGFGLTFTPIEGLVFGTGANFGFGFNPKTMQVTTGSLYGYGTTGGTGVQNPFTAGTFDVTISYTF